MDNNINIRTKTRISPLVLSIRNQVPTLPNPLQLQLNQNGWKLTDLADGEYAINSVDKLFFWRNGNQIFTFNLTDILSTLSVLSGAAHAPVTILNSSTIQFTLTGQQITAIVLAAGIDHNSLLNLTTGDPHTQYSLTGHAHAQYSLTTHTHAELHTHANFADLNNVSGTNSGDQVGDGTTITGAGTVGDPFKAVGGTGGGDGVGGDLYLFYNY